MTATPGTRRWTTLPLMGGKDSAGKLQELLEKTAGGKVLGHDLYLYVRQKSSLWGLSEEFLSAPALDDLACAWGCTQGFLNAKDSGSLPVLCVFDSEEVGSSSVQGAASCLLESVLGRICQALNLDKERMLSNAFMVSADNAHAIHPNHPEYADSQNAPVLGGGVVLKFNANQRYTTDGVSAAIFRKVCRKAEVPVQTYYNRADLPGGSTLGNISLSHVSVPTADIGLPQLGHARKLRDHGGVGRGGFGGGHDRLLRQHPHLPAGRQLHSCITLSPERKLRGFCLIYTKMTGRF